MWNVECGMWSVEGDVGAVLDLGAEIVAALVGSVEAQCERVARKVVDEGARVTAESGAVGDGALGIEADDGGIFFHGRLKCLKTKRTMTKLVGTAMARTARGASSRLSPSHRKKLKSTMWSR